ncbi:2-dehydropantoate 2-reductase (plasmid) [Deinococcus metallilatus]|uniref:2-dehydropantoate 2-reductase n=1 Tax=Deinococcus metallilatus TaxID=1211322 RepID=A0AAJ5FC63_9DEIO|nr:2-dehydropantoate 2-reductase [Deinococcus metallilatus]MBB5293425.1 2-dehydropantoate 2-reductase [Deinococcus metallilatus]QBY06518.1 2-dehydropantoate 2-reductase [Deinococcus metallilatus]RXJ17861.1 2-dehydropantoate 2-reductase [Deinococcus metallilatus]TLK32133.1 2-dehydropantoate 2-reductase [Deinococcus metallilatus]GMA15355.1 2-dehydropantoate 2-reductase [Deinococcus metallilatus]
MRVLVWGAGAIGGTLGASFTRAGHDVTLVDRAPEHVQAIRGTGLGITGPIDEFSVRAPAFTPEELQGTWDTVILCTKAQDTAQAARQLEPHLTAHGVVVSAQNGLNELVLARELGEARVMGCFVNFGADYHGPGLIHYGGRGAVVLGELDGQDTPRLHDLHGLFLTFDDRAITTPNIWGYLWSKLAYGALLFATALTNDSIADALARLEYRSTYMALAREVLRVAAAQGIRPEAFDGFDPAAFLPGASDEQAARSLDDLVAFNRRSAKTHSGIWRDLAVRRRPTEVVQEESIVRAGREVGVPTPITARLVAIVRDLEAGRRSLGLENLDLLRETAEAAGSRA